MNKIVIIVAICILAENAIAQTKKDSVFSKDVIVTNQFDPVISEAFKINILPENVQQNDAKPTFKYAVEAKTIGSKAVVEKLMPVAQPIFMKNGKYKNFVSGGFGNYTTQMGSLYYNVFTNTKRQLDILGTHYGSFGEVGYDNGTQNYAPWLKDNIGINYKQKLGSLLLGGLAEYTFVNTRFFGEVPSVSAPYQIPGVNDYIIPSALFSNANKRQYFNDFGVTLNLSKAEEDADFLFESAAKYNFYNDRFDNRQHLIALDGVLDFKVTAQRAGVNAGIDILLQQSQISGMNFLQNITSPYINPWFRASGETWRAKAGFRFDAHFFEKVNPEFYLVPDVSFGFNVIKDIVKIDLFANGGVSANDFRSITKENPYFMPGFAVKPTFTPINTGIDIRAFAGKNIAIFGGFSFANIRNQYFYVNLRSPNPDNVFLPTGVKASNRFDVVYDDLNKISYKYGISWVGSNALALDFKGSLHRYDLKTLKHAWHNPEYDFTINANYKFTKKISGGISYLFSGGRYAPDGNGKHIYMNNISSLNLDAKYDFNQRISAFAKVNNLLASKYQLWYGYPEQRFLGLVGATFRF